jgi:uncharacterized protein YdeI (YjbR/CyaY-like superfamily)
MEITRTLYATTRDEWRAWLAENYRTEKEIWLVYPKKQAGKPRIPYADAVEEALCFGWIDSTQKGLDDDHTAQRYTPRRPGIPYSQTNQERLRRMIAQGKVLPEVLESIGDLLDQPFQIPADIRQALQANEPAWSNLRGWPEPYLRIRVAHVDYARDDPDEFQKRLRNLVEKSRQGKQYGFGIEAFYS